MHATPKPDIATHEPLHRRIVESLREVVFQTDAVGKWSYLSPTWTELTGYPMEESLGQSPLQFIHPDDHEHAIEMERPLVERQKESCRHEIRYLRRAGGFVWVEVYTRLLEDEDGRYLGTCGTIGDISERRKAGEALARRERYLSGMVEMQNRLLAMQQSDSGYGRLLEPIGRASGASRVYLCETHRSQKGDLLMSQRAEWCAPGIPSQMANPLMQNVAIERALPRWYEALSRGQGITGRVKDFPPEERELLEPQGILSLLALPLWVHGTMAGMVAFDNCVEAREWDKLELDLLSAATGTLAMAMEHRHAERALREREQRFRRLAENASDVQYRYQLAGVRSFAFISGVVARKLGYGPDEHYRDPELWHRLVHPADREALEQLLNAPQSASEHPVELRFQTRAGQTVWLQHVLSPVMDSSGVCVAIEGIARDITANRQVEEALKLSEASFRILLEGVPDPAAIQRDGRIIYANAALVATLGYERPEELMQRRLEEFVLDEPPPVDGQSVLLTGERRLLRRDGKVRMAELASLPLLFDGEPAIVCIARDVTEQRQLQSRLALADRLASMGTLAAGIAHEINNPLAFVISNLGFLSDELRRATTGSATASVRVEADEWRTVLSEAREGAERVRQIVRQLKTFSRPDEERVGPVDLHAVLDSAVMLATNEIRHRAQLRRVYGPVPSVMANEGRLCQVFLNLVVNAAQAIPEGAADRNEIRLVTRPGPDGRLAVIEVQDTGVGIAREALGRIFDPFFTTKPVGVGTGLGLSICHGIVTSLGGDISVESEPGKGTTVRVLLPVAEDGTRREDKPAEQPQAPTARRGRVLVVDDEPAVGRALKRILREHDVELVTSGRQALEKLNADKSFHAILCDVMMPDLAGKDLYEEVQKSGLGLEGRFVFVSGGAFTQGAREFLARVPNPTLEKPFDEAAVRQVVRELVVR
jgi:PAS domain S-box-containing protein